MINKKLISTLLLAVLTFSSSWAASDGSDNQLDNLKVGIDFGFGFPSDWVGKKSDSGIKASPNINLGANVGYDFYWRTIYKSFKLGPEIGLAYGFTKKWKPSSKSILEEKYLNIPISFRLLRYLDEKEHHNEEGYVALGGSIGYELNVLLSSVYTSKQGTTKLHPSSQPVKDSEGFTMEVPKLTGSIIANMIAYFGRSLYLGFKVRVPTELFVKESPIGGGLTAGFLRDARIQTTSILEMYLGVDVMKWI